MKGSSVFANLLSVVEATVMDAVGADDVSRNFADTKEVRHEPSSALGDALGSSSAALGDALGPTSAALGSASGALRRDSGALGPGIVGDGAEAPGGFVQSSRSSRSSTYERPVAVTPAKLRNERVAVLLNTPDIAQVPAEPGIIARSLAYALTAHGWTVITVAQTQRELPMLRQHTPQSYGAHWIAPVATPAAQADVLRRLAEGRPLSATTPAFGRVSEVFVLNPTHASTTLAQLDELHALVDFDPTRTAISNYATDADARGSKGEVRAHERSNVLDREVFDLAHNYHRIIAADGSSSLLARLSEVLEGSQLEHRITGGVPPTDPAQRLKAISQRVVMASPVSADLSRRLTNLERPSELKPEEAAQISRFANPVMRLLQTNGVQRGDLVLGA